MTTFEQVLSIAQEQLAAVTHGDLGAAVGRLDERAALLAAAAAPRPQDTDIIHEILRLDRILSGAIRERMVAIRDEAMNGQRSRRALDGYGQLPPTRSRILDAVS